MKHYLTSLPVLVAPDPGEMLFLYMQGGPRSPL
jgi:hypothetical protein